MKSIVIYSSKTGFTERYARWIAEDLQCTCKPIKDVNSSELSDYDCVIYGGWLMAGNIKDILKLRQLKGLGREKDHHFRRRTYADGRSGYRGKDERNQSE